MTVSIAFFGMLILFSCWLVLREEKAGRIRHRSGASARMEFGFNDFTFTEYERKGSDEKKFTISGKKLGLESKRFWTFKVALAKEIALKDVEMAFYEGNMLISSLFSENAISDIPFDEKTMAGMMANHIEFSGGIVLMTTDKRTLTCDRLSWDKAGRLLAQGNCVLAYDGKRLRADTIDTDVKLRDFNASKDKKKRLRGITELLKWRI